MRDLPLRGNFDATYGSAGIAVIDGARTASLFLLLPLTDGGALAVGNCPGATTGIDMRCSARLNASGKLDIAHATAPVAPPIPFRTISFPYGAALTGDGGYVVNAVCAGTHPNPAYIVSAVAPCMAKFLANGALDATFGSNGFAVADFAAGRGSLSPLDGKFRTHMTQSQDGSIAVAFGCRQDWYAVWEDCIVKWQSDGRPTPGFGVNGIVTLPGQAGCEQSNVRRMSGYPDGRMVLFMNCSGALGVDFSGKDYGQRARRLGILKADGVVDSTVFGLFSSQFATNDTYGTAALFVRSDGMINAHGAIALLSTQVRDVMALRLKGVPTEAKPILMIEYRYVPLGYYFATARTTEQQLLDKTAGWYRTGESFAVSAQLAEGTSPMTRFYFDGIAASGKRGSHFYTTLTGEASAVQSLNPLNEPLRAKPINEGTAGFAFNVTAAGSCPANTVPVYRAFRGNARFPDDPNHRFTTRRDLYDALVSQGWDGEGVKFCAIKTS